MSDALPCLGYREVMNPTSPLVPAAYDVMWSVLVVGLLGLLAAALWSIHRSRTATAHEQLAWTLVVLLLPVVGPLLWFVARVPRRVVTVGEDATGAEWHSRRGQHQ